jgi:hypothetical protein
LSRNDRHGQPAFQDSHHHIIMPFSVDKGCFSLSALNDEAAFFIGADGSVIVRNDTHRKAMQF